MSEPTTVVNIDSAAFEVYIGRSVKRRGFAASKWANPYPMTKERSRPVVIAMFCEYLRRSPELMAALPELKGKVLGCWCAPKACHGDVLADLANALPEVEP